jgi:hypothetical protein
MTMLSPSHRLTTMSLRPRVNFDQRNTSSKTDCLETTSLMTRSQGKSLRKVAFTKGYKQEHGSSMMRMEMNSTSSTKRSESVLGVGTVPLVRLPAEVPVHGMEEYKSGSMALRREE